MDGEDDAHQIIPGQWEDSEEQRNMLDIERLAGNRDRIHQILNLI